MKTYLLILLLLPIFIVLVQAETNDSPTIVERPMTIEESFELNDTINVIIELKEEPIIPSNKRLEKEPAYDHVIHEKWDRLLGIYDDKRKFKINKENIEKQHSDIKKKVQVDNEYKYTFNGVSAEVTQEKYEDLLKDNNVKKIWKDEIIYINAIDDVQLSDAHYNSSVDKVWNMEKDGFNITGNGIKIAILDTGIRYTHVDFGNCSYQEILDGNCEKIGYMWDFANDDDDAWDDNLHGTHVSGIASANGNIKGVAPNSTLYVYKVCNSGGGCSSSDIIQAIENATLSNVDVISMSLSQLGYSDSIYSTSIDSAFRNGTVTVVSAGNEGYHMYTVGYPSSSLNAITVGALCLPNQYSHSKCIHSYPVADFSSRGLSFWSNGTISVIKPDILAAGVAINSTYYGGDREYAVFSGTSMSAPYISGMVALIIQAHPEYTPSEVKSSLVNYADRLSSDYRLNGGGRLNAINTINSSLIIFDDKYQSMLYFGSNFNSSINVRNFTKIINITNRWDSDIIFNLSVDNISGVNIQYDNSNKQLSPNESLLLQINISLNNSYLKTSIMNGTFVLNNNLSQNISIPFMFYNILNPEECPFVTSNEITENLIMTNAVNCTYPDFLKSGAIKVESSNIIVDCNGSLFDGYEFFPTYTYSIYTRDGSSGIKTNSMATNISIVNCSFTNYAVGIYLYFLGFSTRTGNISDRISFINNNDMYNVETGIYTRGVYDQTYITNNNIYGMREMVDEDLYEVFDSAIKLRNTFNYSNISNNNISSSINAFIASDGTFTIYNHNITGVNNSLLWCRDDCNITLINVTSNGEAVVKYSPSTITKKFYLTINVTNSSGDFISNSNIKIYGQSELIWEGNTTINARIYKEPIMNYIHYKDSSINYSNLTIVTTKEGYNQNNKDIYFEGNQDIDIIISTEDEEDAPPYFTYIPDNFSGLNTTPLLSDFDADDGIGIDSYFINYSDTFSINSTGHLINLTILSINNYTINVSVNDTGNNITSVMYSVEILSETPSDTIAPTWVEYPQNVTLEYLTDSLYVDFNATDDVGLSEYFINKTAETEATICYQETANVSTVCGGLDTGNYNWTGEWHGTGVVGRTFDGSWTTGGYSLDSGTSTEIYINYSKPTSANNYSLWQVKDSGNTINLSIHTSCWEQPILQFMANSSYVDGQDVYWYCKNETNWHLLREYNLIRYVYEEAMWWNISTSINYFNITYGDGILTNTTVLPVGNYTINVSINDTSNNINLTLFNIEVAQDLECNTDEECGFCEKCVANECTFQSNEEDTKDECDAINCTTGTCDGSGSCGLIVSGDGYCDACFSCSPLGECEINEDYNGINDSVVDEGSGTCEDCYVCSVYGTGECVVEPSNSDLSLYCGGVECDDGGEFDSYYWGWDTLTCYYRQDEPAESHFCEGDGTCYDADDFGICDDNDQDGSTGITCDCEEAELNCLGTTGGSCDNELCSTEECLNITPQTTGYLWRFVNETTNKNVSWFDNNGSFYLINNIYLGNELCDLSTGLCYSIGQLTAGAGADLSNYVNISMFDNDTIIRIWNTTWINSSGLIRNWTNYFTETDPYFTANFSNMQTDCPDGNYTYGIYPNGTLKCRDDIKGEGSASSSDAKIDVHRGASGKTYFNFVAE